MNAIRLLEFYYRHRECGESMVLASVVDTGGSTYSKTGEMMLISERGEFCGMLSGGCLEGDLVERAKSIGPKNRQQLASYDLAQDDEPWGLGIGCDGSMQIFLQLLLSEEEYAPFASIATVLNGRHAAPIRLSEKYSILVSPSPSLLVLGAGADSEPVVNMATELGWRCVVVDHRPAYTESRRYNGNVLVRCIETAQLASELVLDDFDLAVVMSHHLVSDKAYLSQLAASRIQYIGLLGPPSRRDRLMRELGGDAERLAGRLRAPAGLQIGGRGAGAIAVEIIAQMQQFIVAPT
jgi:xanthine dehydrogenase accessory factor